MSNAGGIATRNYGTISDCTNSGNITSTSSCGGITRWNYGTIINCTNSGAICGSSGAVGGISYTNADGKISHCVNTGAVKGTGTFTTNERVGGIIGWNEGTIEYCLNRGTLSGARTLYDAQFGGIAGRNDDRIRCCANLANLSLTDVSKVGGIVGYAGHMSTSTVQDCYNLGNIRGYGSAVAGICCDSASASSVLIKNCYNYETVGTGAMYSSTYGIVGSSSTSKTVVLNCYVLSDSADVSGTDVTDATAEEFASGKIAWLLNGEAATKESVWGQNIDGADPDPYPVLGTPLVYYGKTDCQEEDRYTNTQTGVGIHTMKKTSAVEATCTADGNNEYYTCSKCGGVFSDSNGVTETTVAEQTIGRIPHAFGAPTFTWAEDHSSCSAVYTCEYGCGETESETCTVATETVAGADCKHQGTITHTATCGEYTDTVELPGAYGEHTSGEPVRENVVEATCKKAGSYEEVVYDEVVYCSVCEIELSREKKTIEKTETHTEETIPGKDATCAEPGLKEGKKCGVCGIILVAQEEIPALGHSFADGVCGNCGLYGGYCGDADINGGKNVMWLLDSEGLMTISGTGRMEDYSAYNTPWIDHRAKVKALVVEEGVTRLGTHAFRSCTAMETVSLPESLTVIGDNAFAFYSVLMSVSLSRNLSSIEGHAFYYCDALTEITIPASVKSMGTWIFNSNGLKTVTFEGSAPYINTSAFYGVTATVYYPDEDSSWEGVAGHDFGGLLTWVPPVEGALVVGKCGDDLTWRFNTLENTLWILGTGAMYDFTEDTVPWAEYRERITSVDLSDEMTHLGDFACYGISNLKSITIPKGMTSLGTRVFEGCAKLQFSVDSSNRSFSAYNGAIYDYTNSILYSAPSVSGVFTAHGYTNTVMDYAFAGNDRITRFEAAARITSINPYAFSGCTSLSELYFPGIAPTIGENAFLGVTATAEYLSNQSSWTSDVLQNYGGRITWKKLDVIAVVSRSDLSWVLTADGVMRFYGQYAYEIPGGCNPNGGAWYQYRDYIKHVIIPSQFSRVHAYAFYGCTSLKSIYLHGGGNDITVGDYAFYNCTSLEEASFDIRTSLGAYAFANCFSLEEIYFNSSGSSLSPFSAQNTSFSGVTADVLCPYKVSLISSQFGGTLTYKNVDYGTCGTNVRWSFDASTGTLTLTGTGTTSSYFSGSFTPWTYRNDQIKAIHVGEGITNLPSYIFEYCTAVTQVKLPETLVSFSPNAFNDCKVLNNLLIPRGVSEIMKDNFNRCNNLTDIYYLGTAAEWEHIKNSDSFKVRLDDGDAAFTVHFLQWHEPTATCEESGVEGHYAFEEPSVYDHMYDQDWQKITTLERVPALGHEWTGGSCTTPKTCSVCGETEGEALGHKWNDATCTTPKTCSVCGETEGEALGHKWNDATCTTPKTCSVCGETEGEALGHDFVDGKCSRCEEKDPDYKEPEVTGVTRTFGATRYDTAFKAADQLKENLGIEKFENIVVAYGEDFADALSGSYLANQKNAPILLVKNRNKEINLVKDYIKSNLTPGGTVYLLGGVNAVPKAMESGLEGFNVKRLAGATRYETNLEILKEAGISGNDILVCTGLDFADGLSASAVNKPILLVKDSLRATQVNYLKTLGTKDFYLIGGTNAVNKRIESALSAYGTTQRIEGATRYYTSVNIAKSFFPNAKTAVLAYAQNFPDGLSGGCLACSMNAPLILTANGKQAPAVAYAKEAGITGGAVLGGTGLIPDKIVRSIFAMNEEDFIIVK